jgi:transposase
MPAPRKYDQETRDRAARMYQERRRDFPAESKLAARRRVGELLDVKPETLRGWIEQREVDTGAREGVSTDASEELKRLRRENAELRRANDILKTASAFFAQAELDRRLS